MSIPTLTTDNLILRPFTSTDAVPMHHIISGKDVLKYFPGTQSPTPEQVEKMIDRLLAHWQEKGYGLWAVAHRSTGALLGRCGLQFIQETDEVEIDFILDRQYWGQGFATEAGQASLQFGFNTLKVTSIVGIVHPGNIASQRVLEKVGMQFVEEKEYFGMACYRYVGKRPFRRNGRCHQGAASV
ncbi:MAG: GNAT family N-acetyltransferase [Chloroflexi bacterium]|nr:GNAT family N-acetyltransferase [Chloroflexota bacterium]